MNPEIIPFYWRVVLLFIVILSDEICRLKVLWPYTPQEQENSIKKTL